ncbi:MAG: hypothetical protein AAGF11_18750 [Myxococcota bacterium]
MPSTRTLGSLGLFILTACDLGQSRTIITSAQVSSVAAVATNTDADLMFMGTAGGQIAQADPSTGVVHSTSWLWGGASSAMVAVTPDGQDSARVWSLHADGWVVNWADGPVLTDFFAPPPFAGVERTLCDLDHAQDGDFYVSTVEDGQAQLWRRDGGTNVWMSSIISGDACPRIAHDLYHDELYVLRGDGFTFEHRNADSLALQSWEILDADGGAIADVDVFGNAAVGAGTSSAPNLPGGGQGPAFNMAWSFDPATGNTVSAKIISMAAPAAVHITVNANTGNGEMLIGSPVGNPTVRGVQLLVP